MRDHLTIKGCNVDECRPSNNSHTGISCSSPLLSWKGGDIITIENPDDLTLGKQDLGLTLRKRHYAGYPRARVQRWNGSQWEVLCLLNKGETTSRPTSSLTANDAGFQFFDTDLGKMIVWNGTAWVNMDGTALS